MFDSSRKEVAGLVEIAAIIEQEKLVLRFYIRPVDGAFELLAIMDIRARSSHSRFGPEGHMGHLITNALASLFSISSFRLADLGGKANSCFRISLSRQPSPW